MSKTNDHQCELDHHFDLPHTERIKILEQVQTNHDQNQQFFEENHTPVEELASAINRVLLDELGEEHYNAYIDWLTHEKQTLEQSRQDQLFEMLNEGETNPPENNDANDERHLTHLASLGADIERIKESYERLTFDLREFQLFKPRSNFKIIKPFDFKEFEESVIHHLTGAKKYQSPYDYGESSKKRISHTGCFKTSLSSIVHKASGNLFGELKHRVTGMSFLTIAETEARAVVGSVHTVQKTGKIQIDAEFQNMESLHSVELIDELGFSSALMVQESYLFTEIHTVNGSKKQERQRTSSWRDEGNPTKSVYSVRFIKKGKTLRTSFTSEDVYAQGSKMLVCAGMELNNYSHADDVSTLSGIKFHWIVKSIQVSSI